MQKWKNHIFVEHVLNGLDIKHFLSREFAYSVEIVIKVDEVQNIFNLKSWSSDNSLKSSKPYCVTTERWISFSLLPKVKIKLEYPKGEGIIATQLTVWIATIVPIQKKKYHVHLCVSQERFNLAIKREIYMLPNVADVIQSMSNLLK